MVVGTRDKVQVFLEQLRFHFLLKIASELGGSWQKLLAGEYHRVPGGFVQRCKQSLYDKLFALLGLEKASAVGTPGVKQEMRVEGEVMLEAPGARLFREATGVVLHIVLYRPDCQYCAKECARGMSAPTRGDMIRLKRLARYMLGTRYLELWIVPVTELQHLVECHCDSDWATDKVERKSTSGAVVCWAGATMMSFARTQSSPATSSVEAEGNAMGSGGAEALGIQAFLAELEDQALAPVCLKIRSDSSAGISAQSRLGLGKLMKHVQIRFLFLQDLVKKKRVVIEKVHTDANPADMFTKCVTKEVLERHKKAVGLREPSRPEVLSVGVGRGDEVELGRAAVTCFAALRRLLR